MPEFLQVLHTSTLHSGLRFVILLGWLILCQRHPCLFSFFSLFIFWAAKLLSCSGSTDWKIDFKQPGQYLALGKCLPTLTSNDYALSFNVTFGANIFPASRRCHEEYIHLRKTTCCFEQKYTRKAYSIFLIPPFVS